MDIAVSTAEERLQRFMQLVNDRLNEEKENKDRKKNKNFTQMYPKGFERVIAIIEEYPLAAKLYMFLAKHIEPGTGAVVASQDLLADELNVSVRSIQRAAKWLDENNVVLKIRLGAGSVYAYCLDPDEVWKSWNTTKKYAAFNTKTLARQKDNGDIKRRLMVMLKGNDPSDVFRDGTAEPDIQLTEENPTHQL
jgi:hypothetical protein